MSLFMGFIHQQTKLWAHQQKEMDPPIHGELSRLLTEAETDPILHGTIKQGLKRSKTHLVLVITRW